MSLFEAIETADLQEVTRLLQDPTLATQHHLNLAVSSGCIEIVKLLLIIPTVRDNAAANNNEARRSASMHGHLEAVKLLLEIPAVKNNTAINNNEALR